MIYLSISTTYFSVILYYHYLYIKNKDNAGPVILWKYKQFFTILKKTKTEKKENYNITSPNLTISTNYYLTFFISKSIRDLLI